MTAKVTESQRSESVGSLFSSSNSEILCICFLGQQRLALRARAGLVERVLRWHPRFISGTAGHEWVWELPSFTRDGCPQRRPYVKLSQPKPQAAALVILTSRPQDGCTRWFAPCCATLAKDIGMKNEKPEDCAYERLHKNQTFSDLPH